MSLTKCFQKKTWSIIRNSIRLSHSKDLQEPSIKPKIDRETLALLERLSLVDCANKTDVETLESAVLFADQILEVNVAGVNPLVTVLEDIPLTVREDEVTDGNCKDDILKNAAVTEDGYFVTPPGNVVLEKENS